MTAPSLLASVGVLLLLSLRAVSVTATRTSNPTATTTGDSSCVTIAPTCAAQAISDPSFELDNGSWTFTSGGGIAAGTELDPARTPDKVAQFHFFGLQGDAVQGSVKQTLTSLCIGSSYNFLGYYNSPYISSSGIDCQFSVTVGDIPISSGEVVGDGGGYAAFTGPYTPSGASAELEINIYCLYGPTGEGEVTISIDDISFDLANPQSISSSCPAVTSTMSTTTSDSSSATVPVVVPTATCTASTCSEECPGFTAVVPALSGTDNLVCGSPTVISLLANAICVADQTADFEPTIESCAAQCLQNCDCLSFALTNVIATGTGTACTLYTTTGDVDITVPLPGGGGVPIPTVSLAPTKRQITGTSQVFDRDCYVPVCPPSSSTISSDISTTSDSHTSTTSEYPSTSSDTSSLPTSTDSSTSPGVSTSDSQTSTSSGYLSTTSDASSIPTSSSSSIRPDGSTTSDSSTSSNVRTTTSDSSSVSSTSESSSETVVQESTTSTVYATKTYTITSCASTVTNCPVGHVTTEIISLYTTVCPVTSKPTKPPSPKTTSPLEITSVKSGYTISTVYTVKIYTITSCAPTVTNCPVGSVTTETSSLYTTSCQVSEFPSVPASPTPPKEAVSSLEASLTPVDTTSKAASVSSEVVAGSSLALFVSSVTTYPGEAMQPLSVSNVATSAGIVTSKAPSAGTSTVTAIVPTSTPVIVSANDASLISVKWLGSVLSLVLAGVFLL